MRAQIFDFIYDQMEVDKDLFFLTADMGINLVERIQKKYPDRFLNVGIAEQNLIGVSAGLVNAGYRPIAYTISNFLIHRCFEQIRNDVVLHQYPVTLLGISTGFDNAPLGPTHHMVDDWGALRTLHGIDVYCPSSARYATRVMQTVLALRKPAYIRIPKGEFPRPETEEEVVHLKGATQKVLLVSYGACAQECLKAQESHPEFGCLVFNKLFPLNAPLVLPLLAEYERIVVVEDHFPTTGLYGAICEMLVSTGARAEMESRAPASYYFQVGKSNGYFHQLFRADSRSLSDDLKHLFGK